MKPTHRVVVLELNGSARHFLAPNDDRDLGDLMLGELKPCPSIDAEKWLAGVLSKVTDKQESTAE